MVIILFAAVLSVRAATLTWSNTGTGDWFTASNWGGTLPAAGDTANIRNGGTATISSGATPSLGYINAGFNAGESGSITLSGGTLNVTNLAVGRTGTGTITIGAGAAVNSDYPTLGVNAGGVGTVNVYGTLNKTGATTLGYVGKSGTGTVNVYSGGSFTIDGPSGVIVGMNGTGTVSVIGGSVSGTSFRMAGGSGGKGTFILDGGSVNLTGGFDMDNSAALGNATLQVIGSDGVFSVRDLLTKNNEYTVIDMVADAAGFTTIQASGILELNGTLNVDLSAYTGDFSTPVVLFENTSGAISGTFDTVNITGKSGVSLVYNEGTVTLIPEPATIGLFFLGMVGVLTIRRRGALM